MAKKKVYGLIAVIVAVWLLVFILPKREYQLDKEPTKTHQGTKKKPTASKASKDKAQNRQLPTGKTTDWNLILVNDNHAIKHEAEQLTTMKNGYQLDKRVYPSYLCMEAAAKKAGYQLVVISAYRSIAHQEQVYRDNLNGHLAEGMGQAAAKKATEDYITVPGKSEHHTGLALDVVDEEWYNSGQGLEEEFCNTKAGKWLKENAHEYGFIVRYPKEKERITGINYEPWHLRFVGNEHAEYIYAHQLSFEEYVNLLEKREKNEKQ